MYLCSNSYVDFLHSPFLCFTKRNYYHLSFYFDRGHKVALSKPPYLVFNHMGLLIVSAFTSWFILPKALLDLMLNWFRMFITVYVDTNIIQSRSRIHFGWHVGGDEGKLVSWWIWGPVCNVNETRCVCY